MLHLEHYGSFSRRSIKCIIIKDVIRPTASPVGSLKKDSTIAVSVHDVVRFYTTLRGLTEKFKRQNNLESVTYLKPIYFETIKSVNKVIIEIRAASKGNVLMLAEDLKGYGLKIVEEERKLNIYVVSDKF